ncbi:LysR family transcriptional regulator [Candidatus Puniceispirillum marinum]|uniref:Transcriptional regulator, LysR family, putative n=1 Tax=Puniceispirillum marinum (strain IMCC1322) TaxID=488538 RepID=D5BPW3_PUNMI|nr:LysR family transcriptional regulator [Candidatus Puniceispirillum marinum]ADE40615.1 transcriptional regulator, LysR family, putative [Candidatus Puniceispirillum marinum IMCC1322]
MYRNLDMTALRSFVTVADTGGVTRAAGKLHVTQSAVSMQLKRLENLLDTDLIERSGRGISLTAQGEQLLGYGRRMLALNDEAWGRLTHDAYEGDINLGVPPDIIYPHIPEVLHHFATDFPRVNVKLTCEPSLALKENLAHGQADIILTTETKTDANTELLQRTPLRWYGAVGGEVWKKRPVQLAYQPSCIFRSEAIATLDQHDITWDIPINSNDYQNIMAFVSADLAITAVLEGTHNPNWEIIPADAGLPPLPNYGIHMYIAEGGQDMLVQELARFIRLIMAKTAH